MRKQIFILALMVFFIAPSSKAQKLSHYFSYGTVPYLNLFNKEKDNLLLSHMWAFPAFSYKIENRKFGLEAYYINEPIHYYALKYSEIPYPDSNILHIRMNIVGIVLHYRAFERKWIKVNPNIGLTYQWYKATCLHSWRVFNQNPDFTWYEPHLYGESESKIGTVFGLNVNFPIYKGIFLNTNARYSVFPTAKYNKQNLIWEIGIGYLFYRK